MTSGRGCRGSSSRRCRDLGHTKRPLARQTLTSPCEFMSMGVPFSRTPTGTATWLSRAQSCLLRETCSRTTHGVPCLPPPASSRYGCAAQVYSFFEYSSQCSKRTLKLPMEPLVGMMRHPFVIPICRPKVLSTVLKCDPPHHSNCLLCSWKSALWPNPIWAAT